MLLLMLGCLLVETGEIVHTCEKMETCIEQGSPQAEVIDADLDGHSADQGDCDDSDPAVFPGAAFLDSELLCMRDRDGDGFGDAAATNPITAGQDCDDQDARSYPGAGYAEPGLIDLCAADQDGDGYLAPEDGGSDCDPADSLTFPGSTAVEEGVDRDCDRIACAASVPELDELSLMMFNQSGAIICEAVWLGSGVVLSQRYCGGGGVVGVQQSDGDFAEIVNELPLQGHSVFWVEEMLTSKQLPLLTQDAYNALEFNPDSLFVAHHNTFGFSEANGQFEIQPVQLIEVTPDSVIVNEVQEAAGGSGLFYFDGSGFSLVGTLDAGRAGEMSYLPAHLMVDDVLAETSSLTIPVYCD